MKILKLLPCAAILSVLASCGSDKPKPMLELWGEKLLDMYPNYRSNELAEASILDSISAFGNSHIGKAADFCDGVEFKFDKLITNPQTGGHSAVFYGEVCADIESDAAGGKYIMSNFGFNVIGAVSDEQAAKLSDGLKYVVSGSIKDWDAEDLLGLKAWSIMPNDHYMGVFVFDNISVAEIKE